jgi:glutamine synthetase
MLAAGLDGIRRELPAIDATEENPYSVEPNSRKGQNLLPASLDAAIEAMEEDEVVCASLGPHIARRFIEAKRIEWHEASCEVTPWEISKYMSNY